MGKKERNDCDCENTIKNLQAKNKELQKENRKLKNELDRLEELVVNLQSTNATETGGKRTNEPNKKDAEGRAKSCPKCGKGTLQKTTVRAPFKVYIFNVCHTCWYREKVNE